MFCQNEILCTFDVLKRDDAASPDAFQLNNNNNNNNNNNKKTYQAFYRFHQFSFKRIYCVKNYSFMRKMASQ